MRSLTHQGIAITESGPQEASVLLFSAGLGGAGTYWRAHVEAFAGPFRCVFYDQAGTGASQAAALPSPFAVRDMADEIARVLDAVGAESGHIVGHAAGGCAALDLALRRPDRVASATVVNGWDRADRHFARCMAIRRAIYDAQGLEAYLRAQPLFLYPADWLAANLDALDAQIPHHAAHFQSRETLFARMRALEAFDIARDLARITVPVLVISSQDDLLVDAAASRRLAAGIPQAQAKIFERGGHAVNATRPQAFDAALRGFLEAQTIAS